MNPHGLRPMTLAQLQAERAVEEYAQSGARTTKSAVVYALKVAAPALKLPANTWRLIMVLLDMSQPVDWEDSKFGPVVWPSNAMLALKLDIDIRSVQVHLRHLAERGMISYTDSTTRKRYGRRQDGRIVEACGVSLSPLMALRDHFLELAAAYQVSIEERKKLARLISNVRTRIVRMISCGQELKIDGAWSELEQRLSALATRYGTLLSRPARSVKAPISDLRTLLTELARIEELAQRTWDHHAAASELASESAPGGDKRFTQNLNTGIKIERSSKDQKAADLSVRSTDSSNHEPSSPDIPDQETHPNGKPLHRLQRSCPDLALLQRGCPSLTAYYPDAFTTPQRFADRILHLRAMLGISAHAWAEAIRALGPIEASLALLVILDGYEHDRITNPGGYLRGIVANMKAGGATMLDAVLKMATRNEPLSVAHRAMPYGIAQKRGGTPCHAS